VSAIKTKNYVSVKIDEKAVAKREQATGKGGVALAEALANKIGLWSLCRKHMVARKDPTQGYTNVATAAAVVYGLLTGGKGFSCTSPLHKDASLGEIVGLSAIASAGTVEKAMRYQGQSVGGHAGVSQALKQQALRLADLEKRDDLYDDDGLFLMWGDGTLLEREGKDLEAMKSIDGKHGQLFSALFAGPYMVAADFADEGECELLQVRHFLETAGKEFVRKSGCAKSTAILLDSLYGDGPTLDMLEKQFASSRYVVGARKLAEVTRQLEGVLDHEWINTTKRTTKRGWDESGVCTVWVQCKDWPTKRLLVGRRWKNRGEAIWNYSGVFTNFTREDQRVLHRMKRLKIPTWNEAIWSIYDGKQGMESQWKDLLIDQGLHHPPSKYVQANAIFYVIAALNYNLSVGVRRLTLDAESRNMRLWRFRRDVIDLPGRVAIHSRQAVVTLLDARDHLVDQVRRAMQRLALL
jgi:hypothetical protein